MSFTMVCPSVPSANKKDVRTIEDVQADIQAKKKLKTENANACTSNAFVE